MTPKDIKVGQFVKVDGNEGIISAIYPEGNGQYKGIRHAYVWVATPALNYIDILTEELVQNGRAVPFSDVKVRITESDIIHINVNAENP